MHLIGFQHRKHAISSGTGAKREMISVNTIQDKHGKNTEAENTFCTLKNNSADIIVGLLRSETFTGLSMSLSLS